MTESLEPKMRQPAAWIPSTLPVEIACLGKLQEELGELQSAVSRCLIQGFSESHPTTKKSNKLWLKEELADVLAAMKMTMVYYGITEEELASRISTKIAHLTGWHELIEEHKLVERGDF